MEHYWDALVLEERRGVVEQELVLVHPGLRGLCCHLLGPPLEGMILQEAEPVHLPQTDGSSWQIPAEISSLVTTS